MKCAGQIPPLDLISSFRLRRFLGAALRLSLGWFRFRVLLGHLAVGNDGGVNNRVATVSHLTFGAPFGLPGVLLAKGIIEGGSTLRWEQVLDLVGNSTEALEILEKMRDLMRLKDSGRDTSRWSLHMGVDDGKVARDFGI
jgi:hypothetical protein